MASVYLMVDWTSSTFTRRPPFFLFGSCIFIRILFWAFCRLSRSAKLQTLARPWRLTSLSNLPKIRISWLKIYWFFTLVISKPVIILSAYSYYLASIFFYTPFSFFSSLEIVAFSSFYSISTISFYLPFRSTFSPSSTLIFPIIPSARSKTSWAEFFYTV